MQRGKPIYISLTGDNSHKVNIPAGQGSFSIGTTGLSQGKYDVWVEEGAAINWDAFNEFFTGHGRQNAKQHPYGDWPRFIYYSGNDRGFAGWSIKRKIEDFHWTPKEDTSIDLSKSNIYHFSLVAESSKIEVVIGDKIKQLTLSCNLENVDIKQCSAMPLLIFAPLLSQVEARPYQLPVYNSLEKATYVDIKGLPVGQAFDCKSLLQFPNLTSLNLSGNMANLETLAELKHLENIALRYVPDLTNMPKLATWKNLKSFIGWNIEETAGKALRAELNALSKKKELENYSSVSQLRKAIWFKTEYGIPFSAWEGKSEKVAVKAYKACLKEVRKSKTKAEVRKAIIEFIGIINTLPDIETTEREDVATAVCQLVESSALGISEETGINWFYETIN